MKKVPALCLSLVLLAVTVGVLERRSVDPSSSAARSKVSTAVVGNPGKLKRSYELWRDALNDSGRADRLVLPLGWSKGRSSEFVGATGTLAIDLARGVAEIEVRGFDREEELDAWFLAYRPGKGSDFAADSEQRYVFLGQLERRADERVLERDLQDVMGNFELDLAVITPAGSHPEEGGLLFGTPGLFERLYSLEYRDLRASERGTPGGVQLALASPLPIGPLLTQMSSGSNCLDDLVAEGEDLFFNETFEGNGRTCGTCHPADNNLTIDPPFIAKLEKDDPLFVAENIDALNSEKNGGLIFEQPELMREFGLIVENLDGFDDLTSRFTMRGVPHLFAQAISIVSPNPGEFPFDRTGWSGDGSQVGNGTLREFTTGAVIQHFPLTTDRVNHVDFELPDADQLNKIEAFMLSLGRQEELTIATMNFTDPDVSAGRTFFNSQFACAFCHLDAGANSASFVSGTANINFDTGVEEFLMNHADTSQRPQDGGFGTNPDGGFDLIVLGDEGFGNGEFNTPSLVEFADTLPAFHNNITNSTSAMDDTVEGAIKFYLTQEFKDSPGAVGFQNMFNDPEVQVPQVGKFLRVLNALENERQCTERADLAICLLNDLPIDYDAIDRALTVAVADTTDAIDVLKEVGLHKPAQVQFRRARGKLAGAKSGSRQARLTKLHAAKARLAAARADMILE